MIPDSIQTIVFDWGDTLMRVFPESQGPMVFWTEVEALPNAFEMLSTLHSQFKLALASNAQESSAEDIRAALNRVNLGQFISEIYTYHELGAKKPEQGFFRALEQKLNTPAHQLVMIGDDYRKDILPAWNAGWYTMWYNPSNQLAEAHMPVQQYECADLGEIPNLLQNPPLPSLQTCLAWYMQERVTHTLLAHVQTVSAAAYQMTVWLKEIEPHVSPLLAHRGGYLHDLAKLIETKETNHAKLAENLLMAYQQPILAKIAGRHLMGDLKSSENRPTTWEEKIVHYADKLAEGNSLVSLSERLIALKGRYPQFVDKIDQNRGLIETLELEIATALHRSPQELLADLKTALYNGNS
jgi:putative hydrolase of the HAD superfamily